MKIKCLIKGHDYIPHFDGRHIQRSSDSPIGRVVDYFYCERCRNKDPERAKLSAEQEEDIKKHIRTL